MRGKNMKDNRTFLFWKCPNLIWRSERVWEGSGHRLILVPTTSGQGILCFESDSSVPRICRMGIIMKSGSQVVMIVHWLKTTSPPLYIINEYEVEEIRVIVTATAIWVYLLFFPSPTGNYIRWKHWAKSLRWQESAFLSLSYPANKINIFSSRQWQIFH